MRNRTRTQTAGIAAALVAGALFWGCSTDDQGVSLEMRMVQLTPADGLTKMNMTVWGGQWAYYAHPDVLLTEDDVAAATAIEKDGAPAIELYFTEAGKEKLLRVTRENLGRRLGVIIDGHLLCASLIEAPIETGTMVVTGHLLEPAARRVSRALTRAVV